MKKYTALLLFGLILALKPAQAQITLENTYPSAGYFNNITQPFTLLGAKPFYMVKLEVSGDKYVSVDLINQSITFYNLDHSLYISMSYSNVTLLGVSDPNIEKLQCSLMFISEKLFDTDNQIEVLYANSANGNNWTAVTQIVNQDGSIMFTAQDEGPFVKPNYPNQYYPIYNTSAGTKMILSKTDQSAKVYSLGGTYSPLIAGNTIAMGNSAVSLFPNPSGRGSAITLAYDLPAGITSADLKVFSSNGSEIKSYKIGSDMKEVLVQPGELPAGVYYYSIISNAKIIGSKKSIVVE